MGSEDKRHSQSWNSGTMRWETNTKEKNKALKFPFDAMGKGRETVCKEIMYSWHDHIKSVVVWVEEREVQGEETRRA